MARSQAPAGEFCVLYFAAASSYARVTREYFSAPIKVKDLFAKLEEKHPGIGEKVLSCCAVTINLEYVEVDGTEAQDLEKEIKEGDEVALIPPVSSG